MSLSSRTRSMHGNIPALHEHMFQFVCELVPVFIFVWVSLCACTLKNVRILPWAYHACMGYLRTRPGARKDCGKCVMCMCVCVCVWPHAYMWLRTHLHAYVFDIVKWMCVCVRARLCCFLSRWVAQDPSTHTSWADIPTHMVVRDMHTGALGRRARRGGAGQPVACHDSLGRSTRERDPQARLARELGAYCLLCLRVHMYTHICICTFCREAYVCIYIYIYTHTHTDMCVRIYTHTYIYTHIHIYIYIHTYTYIHTYIHTQYIYIYIYIYTHTHIHIHIHTHTHTNGRGVCISVHAENVHSRYTNELHWRWYLGGGGWHHIGHGLLNRSLWEACNCGAALRGLQLWCCVYTATACMAMAESARHATQLFWWNVTANSRWPLVLSSRLRVQWQLSMPRQRPSPFGVSTCL